MPCKRTCLFNKTSKIEEIMIELREQWEVWDLRILTLFVLLAQLYFLFLGRRRRRKSTKALMTIVNVWFLYLFSELLATIALGKLSKLKVSDHKMPTVDPTAHNNTKMANATLGEKELRVMWGPLLLFYLGGPDTITVLRTEENQLWIRHLIGLLTLSIRAAYALIVTWSPKGLSLVAVLIFVPAIIKYGERVWVIKSRSKDNYEGFVQLDLSSLDNIGPSRPNAKIVLLAYFWFQTLMPHYPGYKCIGTRVKNLVNYFREKVKPGIVDQLDPFKLVEIEMGLMYDVLFSKVGTIFTILGSILRVLSFSLILSVLVIYFKCDKPSELLKGDHEITIILVAGAIFLEIGGIVVQLASDWALVWACKYQNQGASLILSLHENLFSKRPGWSGVVGQFSLRDFCTNYKDKPNVWNKMWIHFEPEKVMKRFSSQKSVAQSSPSQKSAAQHFKDLIIGHLREKSDKLAEIDDTLQTSVDKDADVDTSQTSTQKKDVDNSDISTEKNDGSDTTVVQSTSPEGVGNNDDKLPISRLTRGEWTLAKYDLSEQLKWSIELEFEQSIFIWHVATEVFHGLGHGKDYTEVQTTAVKMLSDYMMYLLVVCPSRFCFRNQYKIPEDYTAMKELFNGGGGGRKLSGTDQVNANKLVQALEGITNRWEVMGSMWAEMLCYAAGKCEAKNHIEEIRHGGELLTHVWLLLLHFGITRKQVRKTESTPKDEKDSLAKSFCATWCEVLRDKAENICGGTQL